MAVKLFKINKFFGGIVRDDKASAIGVASNVEELDIFENEDFVRPSQIFTSDSLPASTEVYAYTGDNDDNVWAYGKNTANNAVRLLQVTTGGADNPGAFSTVFTSADTTDIAYVPSPIQYFRRDDGNQDFLYYLTNASGTIKLKAYDITGDSETEQDTGSDNMTLTGLDGSFDRCFMKPMFGELYVGNGQFIAKVDGDGVFTEKAFTLPNGWEAVDIIPVSDVAIILARSINRLANESKGFWWDLTQTVQVDDSFDIPMGGPQWIENHKEQVRFLCAQNGKARIYQLSGAFPGSVPVELPIEFSNVASETATQPISAPKMVSEFDRILYFGLNKTDKTGVYGLGELDSGKQTATYLAKRFGTTDYADHSPTALYIQGANFYGAFDDNGTASTARCETNNSPTRSSNAVYESIWLDFKQQESDKQLTSAYLTSYPLPASTSMSLSIDTDYGGSYTTVTRPDSSVFNSANGVLGFFRPKAFANKKVFKTRVSFTSNGSDAPKLTGIIMEVDVQDDPAQK